MKILVLLVPLVIFFQIHAQCQSCLPQGIIFNDQNEVDNFISDYPGCRVIEGNVKIKGDDITNLDSLIVITAINGDLIIGDEYFGNNPGLYNLNGLDSLSHIGNRLMIRYNADLESLDGLESLVSVGSSFWINNNYNLLDITGLSGLSSIGTDMYIFGNIDLEGLEGLEGISNVFGKAWIATNKIVNMSGLEGLTHIYGDLEISANDDLIDLNGLNNLVNIGGELYIHDNNLLQNLEGLNDLVHLGHNMMIEYNNSLVSLEGLENLTSVNGFVSISDHNSLLSLFGLGGLTSIDSGLFIRSNPGLLSVHGLDNLENVGGDLFIQSNPELINLDGLSSISSIQGQLYIFMNQTLNSLSGLNNLDAGTIQKLVIKYNESLNECNALSICEFLMAPGGSVSIYENAPGCNDPPEIAETCGFTLPCLPFGDYNFFTQADIENFPENYPGCNKLDGQVLISGDDISDLEGLSGVDSIGFRLTIYNNPSLASLSGLEGIVFIDGSLNIQYNDILTDLDGIRNFNSDSMLVLQLFNNYTLSKCDIAGVCSFIANPRPGSDLWIFGNDEGCASEVEVGAACGVGTDEPPVSVVSVSPNPADGIVCFTLNGEFQPGANIQILDLTGKVIFRSGTVRPASGSGILEWDSKSVKTGLYIYIISDVENRPLWTGKIIVK